MQTELPGYFIRIPTRFPRPNGGAYVAPAPEPPRARPLKQPELPEFFQRGLPPFLQYLKQDHANHVRKNKLMCDRRFLGRETRQPVPRQATVALRLPHTLASTPEEHQDNARVVVGYAAKSASIFERSPEEIAAAREERVAIFRALLGPAARAYLDAPDVLVNYHVDFINETVTVWTPDNDAYMAAIAADDIVAQDDAPDDALDDAPDDALDDAPDDASDGAPIVNDLFDELPASSSIPTSVAGPSSTFSSLPDLMDAFNDTPSPALPTGLMIEVDHEFRARRRIVGAVGGGGGHSIATWLASIPAAADAVPVAGTGEMFWPGPGGNEDEGHENGWLTDLIDELDAEGL
ncbi:hypothetical protein B0H17DRAFT_1128859 [Mycena rosella]|uniref:Uncharacterized protein n=1 Tax=Mycena rosella TaxID=1033263 RepID=A0AAD7DW85_MYCRO|nr:hypothetical protein B0H17DRAFT_1128859 [Mycena rosella]